MPKLAIISGTIPISAQGEEKTVLTPYGKVTVVIAHRWVFLPRHGLDPNNYVLPHQINHAAHFSALKALEVEKVIAVNSTGSLKRELQPGSLIVPHDFIFWGPNPTVFSRECQHVTPQLDDTLRDTLVRAAMACGGHVINRGVYWQTWGPRFETRAEIRLMSQWADVVGMTMASEAICASELNLPYAAICSIDNYANGIVEHPLSMEEVVSGAKRNAELMGRIIDVLLRDVA
ncbi:MAG: MTAP family purine nucleoside phosphorylase [Syntrophales bacterium]|nr:MTAP family purine nucleoside phosphorylase [Syntrophales bacterium]